MRILAACAVLVLSAMAARADEPAKDGKLDTPEKCMEAYKAAAMKADGAAMMKCFTAATKKALMEHAESQLKETLANDEAKEEAAKDMGVKVEDLEKMTAEQFLVAKISASLKENKEDVEKTKFEIVKKEDARAVAAVDEGKEHKEKLVLLKADGEWGIDMEESQKAEHEDEDEGEGSK